jgi:peptidyl-prolyl cis-trans isomerase SurA
MRKPFLLFIGSILTLISFGQTQAIILEVGPRKITKSEFLQIYLKNNPAPKYDETSLDEYMDLFTKFKLKVAEAEALGYDTVPKLKKELEGYRKQLAAPYLIDSAKNEAMVQEAYERMKIEIKASHILVRLDVNAQPNDTLIAYNKIMGLRARIMKGEKFEEVARGKAGNGSEDPSVHTNGGDLGYFTAFQMVYPFEDAAYKTKIGDISWPVRTRFGYHLIQVSDSRPARGTMKTSHIMVAVPKGATPEDVETLQKKIDEIYSKLQKGEKFEDLVKNYSDDPSSNAKNGELPAFGTGTTTRMVTAFEDAAFALKNNGDYSRPIRTDYGFHVIKRLEWKNIPTFEEAKKDLQNRVNKDERSMKTQDSYVEKLKSNYLYQDKSKSSIKWFESNVDSTFLIGKWNAQKLKKDKPLFILDGIKYSQQSFARYLEKNQKGATKDNLNTLPRTLLAKWEKEIILGYEESKLETKYPEFKALVNEYHDGIILYEIMTDMIWNKAMQDTVGLKEFFNANRANYQFGDRVDAIVYECYSQNIANQIFQMIQNDTVSSKNVSDVINRESELNLRIKTNKFEKELTPFLSGQSLLKGINKPYILDDKYYVVKVHELIPPTPKELSEAKGPVTSDYQNFLERNWLKELRTKHPVKINKPVLYSLGK